MFKYSEVKDAINSFPMDYKDYYKNLLINNFQGYLFKSPMICKESIKNNIFNHLRFAVFKRMIKDGYTLYHDKQNDKYFFKNNGE